LLLANRADPAGNALAAAFLTEKGGDPEKDLLEADRVVKQHNDSGTERRANGAGAFERERGIERRGGNESAGRAAQQHGLESPVASDASGQIDHAAERSAEGDLVHARMDHVAGKTKQTVSHGISGADPRVG